MMQILICDDDAAFAARLTGELGALMSEKKIPGVHSLFVHFQRKA